MVKKLVDEIAIKNEMIRYKKLLNINDYISFKVNKFPDRNSGTYYKKGIILDLGTAREWDVHPNRARYVLAHELVHAKYDEDRKFWLNIIVPPGLTLEYLLSELRANTIAYQILGQKENVLEDYFYNFNMITSNILNVNGGYLSSDKFVFLIKQNPVWNEQAIVDAVIYLSQKYWFIRYLVSKRRKVKIINYFIKQLGDMPQYTI